MNNEFKAIELRSLMNQVTAIMQSLDAQKVAMLVGNAHCQDTGQSLMHEPEAFSMIAKAYIECSQSLIDIAAEAKSLHDAQLAVYNMEERDE